jgi:Ca2+-binding RTX toxin-like protein
MSIISVVELSTLTGTNGFRISGKTAEDSSGFSVSSAGDVNGDGFDDLIIGAADADPKGTSSGASYVVFGRAGGFAAELNLSTLTGTNGFQINGEAIGDRSGRSVSSAGDVNGDGFDDLIIGAPLARPNGTGSGASYVVFGQAGGFAAAFSLSTLNGTNGFQINGEAIGDGSGRSVSSAGDVNGDGFDDLIIGAAGADPNGSYSGASYVVFGQAGGFAANLDLSTLNGTNGFQISGEAEFDFSGRSVSSAGDVNGDGFDDLIIGVADADPNGTGSGASYVVFGRAGGFAANLDLSTLNGTNGFQINGEAIGDGSGSSVSSAGDVNGDGFDDLIIGAAAADPNDTNSGASYVVFGRAGGFAANLDLSSLNGTNGFRINGENFGCSGTSVSSAGDVNGDGFDDLIIGAPFASPNGFSSGASYVVFGRATGVNRVGTAAAETLTGSKLGDILEGRGGNDTLLGGADDDTLLGGAGDDIVDGGMGADTLRGQTGNDTYIVDDALDVVDETGGNGVDTVQSSVTFNLGSTADAIGIVENLTLTGRGAIDATGNGSANTLTGNAAANVLNGGGGADVLRGLGGNDTYVVDNALDVVDETGGSGIDTVQSSVTFNLGSTADAKGTVENLTLTGSAAINATGNGSANTLTGNAAANVLNGAGGADTLKGLGGNDTFRYASAAESRGAAIDRILDFDDAGDDRVDLAAVYGGTLVYKHDGTFTGAGQVRINDVAGADVIVEVNLDSDATAEMQIRLAATTLASMTASDFIL